MFTTRPELEGSFGMVASTHWLASQSGMAVLEHGGNAFDAAVAAGFVLQVVEPHLNGPGGEVPVLAHIAAEGRVAMICGQGVSPAAASLRGVADLDLTMIPGTGLLPACVPGSFGGWMLLLQRYGTMRPAEVLQYAIGYAESGFPILPRVSATVATVADMFARDWPTSAALWLPEGREPLPHALFRNPALAGTFRRIVSESQAAGSDRDAQIDAAVAAFYRGFVADAIDRFCAGPAVMDVSGTAHRGLLRGSDLATWRATEEPPLYFDYRAGGHTYRVFKSGPWSQAPVLLQQLALLSGFDLDSMAPSSPEFVHTVVEASKLAFADREAFYGDPNFVDVPLADLLSPGYNDGRRNLIGEVADCGPLRPGAPGGRTAHLPDLRALGIAPDGSGSVGEPTVPVARAVELAGDADRTVTVDGETRGDTCHVDVVDRWGNMVSAMPSGGWLQSSPTIPELGFCLGTRAQMFWLQPGLPNSLEPGKRPRTTLSPSMAYRDGEAYLAFGTPGGDQQDQWSLQLFLRHAHFGQNLQEAIDEPAWNSSHFTSSFYPRESHPGELHVEGRMDPATVRSLRGRGHRVVVEDDWSLGRLSAVSRGADGVLRAGANPRGMQGYAAGR